MNTESNLRTLEIAVARLQGEVDALQKVINALVISHSNLNSLSQALAQIQEPGYLNPIQMQGYNKQKTAFVQMFRQLRGIAPPTQPG